MMRAPKKENRRNQGIAANARGYCQDVSKTKSGVKLFGRYPDTENSPLGVFGGIGSRPLPYMRYIGSGGENLTAGELLYRGRSVFCAVDEDVFIEYYNMGVLHEQKISFHSIPNRRPRSI